MKNLEQLLGTNRTVELTIDEALAWREDREMELLELASTSGLCAQIFHIGYDLIQPFLDENEVSVVVEANVRHLAPVKVGQTVAVGVKVIGIAENKIKLRGVVMKGETKILEIEFVRAVVSRNYLRRAALEKTT
ncbi:MAG: thioesterase family protein [Thermotoga caldifontis]|uniref:thioesterase family protein n=1 Tax=Thermotoga caldifontis TaxID=1508419 RepID=UPI003C79E6BE